MYDWLVLLQNLKCLMIEPPTLSHLYIWSSVFNEVDIISEAYVLLFSTKHTMLQISWSLSSMNCWGCVEWHRVHRQQFSDFPFRYRIIDWASCDGGVSQLSATSIFASLRQQDPSHTPSQHQTGAGKAQTQSKGKTQRATHNYFCSTFSRNDKTGCSFFRLGRPQRRWKVIAHLPPRMVISAECIPPAIGEPLQNWKWRTTTRLEPHSRLLVPVHIHFQSRILRLKCSQPLPAHI